MEFTSNLWIMVTESDRISEEHKKELFDILTEMQNIETELIGNTGISHGMNSRRKMIFLGNNFERLYIKYGGYMGMLNECKRRELKRTEGELKELLPKVPNSIKRLFKVK